MTAEYVELTGTARVTAVPLAHLSIEVGHLYMEDFEAGPDRLRALFERAAPWVSTAREACARSVYPRGARVSTCFLVDDYFGQLGTPSELVPQLVEAAASAGIEIDYLARESACARAGEVDLARLVESRLVVDPPPGTTGARPPLTVSGWLANGERSPLPAGGEAMRESAGWRPPSENGANRHSIFLDVQLWDEPAGRRRWSCPYLAATWQLLRLGLLRHHGEPVVQPKPLPQPCPDSWSQLPPVSRLSSQPAAFAAYRTFSVLAGRFLPVEHAVRTILSQFAVETAVAAQVGERAHREGVELAASLVDRIGYAFVAGDAA